MSDLYSSSRVYIPRSLLLQWHITERCNLHCAHCYQTNASGLDLNHEELIGILNQFKELLSHFREQTASCRIPGHITITGGEPFLHTGFLDLLEQFHNDRANYSFAILTNGSFIDVSIAKRLKELNPAFVQVSIEGGRDTHDKIRGSGNFEQTVSSIKHLVRHGIRTLISFTAHRDNYHDFPSVARLGRKLRVSRVWADRLIPYGNAADMREKTMSPEETREFFTILHHERSRARWSWFGRTEISMHRALQFLVGGGKPYHCSAGDSLITIMPNGDLYPCRRMPIRVGNVLDTPLIDLYNQSSLFQQLRHQIVSENCRQCQYSNLCRGGLKCLSYAITGDPFASDPGCWNTSISSPDNQEESVCCCS